MKLVIIGGTGEFGKLYASILKEKYEVFIVGRDLERSRLTANSLGVKYGGMEELCDADIAIVSVPISNTKKTIEDAAKRMKKESLLMDFSSVKKGIVETIAKQKNDEIVSCHPMHGPRVISLEGQVMLFIPFKVGAKYREFRKFFEEKKMKVYETTIEEHDKTLAVVQALTHYMYLCGASTIAKMGNFKIPFSSPIYEMSRDIMSRIATQNPSLYAQIQIYNKYGKEAREIFIKEAEKLNKLADEGDEKKLVESILKLAREIEDVEASLARSDKLVQSMQREVKIFKQKTGQVIAVKNIYSQAVHYGILEDVGPNWILLMEGKKKLKLNISNLRIIEGEELRIWKEAQPHAVKRDFSFVFKSFDDEAILRFASGIDENILKVEKIDEFSLPNGKSVTIRFHLFAHSDVKKLEEKIKKNFLGIGAELR